MIYSVAAHFIAPTDPHYLFARCYTLLLLLLVNSNSERQQDRMYSTHSHTHTNPEYTLGRFVIAHGKSYLVACAHLSMYKHAFATYLTIRHDAKGVHL